MRGAKRRGNIARHGSFARAADALGLTPSAISPHVKSLEQQIDAGDLDAAITTEPVKPHPASLAFTPLYSDRFWVVAALEHKGTSARDLLKTLPFLRFDKRAWAGRIIEDELRRQGLRVHAEMELDSQEALARMAASGLGVAIVPLADTDIARLPPLVRLPFGKPQRLRHVGLPEREDGRQRHLATVLAKALRPKR